MWRLRTYVLILTFSALPLGILGCSHTQISHDASAPLRIEKSVALPKDLKIEDVLRTAMSKVGTHYRFGGNYSEGTDCSGFVQMVFRKHGIRLPHSTLHQSHLGHFVEAMKDVKPGDLVFFETYKRGPSHVGIYLGRDRFIHASFSQKKVIVSKLHSDYYIKRYLGAKRLFEESANVSWGLRKNSAHA